MVACIDNDGNPVRLGSGQPTKQGHTPGPWETSSDGKGDWDVCESGGGAMLAQLIDCDRPETEANAALIAAAPWHALLLRAVLKGFKCQHKMRGVGNQVVKAWLFWDYDGHRIGGYLDDANGLPVCPDAETYQRIRIAVEGQ